MYCVLKIGICCGSDLETRTDLCYWILKYTLTPSRLIQTTDTIHKRLKLDEKCLARDYATSDVFSTQELFAYLQGPRDIISGLETQKVSKNKLFGLEPNKLMLQYPQYLAELGILLQAGNSPWLLGIVVHLVTNLVRTMFKCFKVFLRKRTQRVLWFFGGSDSDTTRVVSMLDPTPVSNLNLNNVCIHSSFPPPLHPKQQ